MKIAVLFTGNIRTLEYCQDNIKQNLNWLNPDYFVTTYDTQYQYHPALRSAFNYCTDVLLEKDKIIELFTNFSPKSIEVHSELETNHIFNEEYPKFHQSMKACSSSHFLQYWKVKQGLNLIAKYELEHNIKYDIIIRTRCDLMLKNFEKLNFENINSKLIVGVGNEGQDFFKCLNDQLFISTFDNMNNLVDYMLSEFYNYTNEKSSNSFPHGVYESAIKHLNLEIVSSPALVDCLYRINGNKDYIN